jgi:hypothetical protein
VPKRPTPKPPPLGAQEAQAALALIDDAIVRYRGGIDSLEQAIGFYLVGRHLGWKVLVLMHNKRTIRKFEEILGINIRETFPELGVASDRSLGYQIASQLSNFWKAVSGDEKIEGRKELK